MKTHTLKMYIYFVVFLFAFCLPQTSFAFVSGDLEVDFQGGGTLFADSPIAPGFTTSKTVRVANHGSTQQAVYTSPTNTYTTGLDTVMQLTIQATSTGTTYFNDSFHTFFTAPNPIYLGQIDPGSTILYTYTASFATSSTNVYQSSTLGFDLVVGFEEGPSITNTGVTTRTGSGTTLPVPHGLVAGASTTTAPFGFPISLPTPISRFIHGLVAGANTTTADRASSTQDIQNTVSSHETSSSSAGLANSKHIAQMCTLVWLLLLVLISWSWSVIDDLLIERSAIGRRFFVQSSSFSAVYVICILLLSKFGLLDSIWYVCVLLWAGFVWFEYHTHTNSIVHWNLRKKSLYYFVCALMLFFLAFFSSLLCAWLPFAVLACVSLAVLLFVQLKI